MNFTNLELFLLVNLILFVALILQGYKRRDIKCSNCGDAMKFNKGSNNWVCISCKAEVSKR